MEYEFIRDFTGLVQARFSMGHEAMGWYDQEFRCSCGLDDFQTMLKEWERFVLRR